MPLQHFVVALLGAKTIDSCGVVVLVADHAGLVCNWPLGRPGIFWLRGWPCQAYLALWGRLAGC